MKIPFVEIPKTHVRIPKSRIHSGHHIKVITSSGKYKGCLGVSEVGWDGMGRKVKSKIWSVPTPFCGSIYEQEYK